MPDRRREEPLQRFMDIKLEHRGVSCVALLLDERAPKTCELVWSHLPVSGGLWHAKYASNEVYCLLPPMAGVTPALENTTITPIPGDVAYFTFSPEELAVGQLEEAGLAGSSSVVNLAVFYGRNNLLLNLRPASCQRECSRGSLRTSMHSPELATTSSGTARLAKYCHTPVENRRIWQRLRRKPPPACTSRNMPDGGSS